MSGSDASASGSVTVRPGLRGLSGYHSPQVDVEVRLNTNESPLAPPDEWRQELHGALDSIAHNRYPDRNATALRQGLAKYHGVDPASIFCANGSNEVLQCLLLAYGGPGRRAGLFEPTYQLHRHISSITSTEVVSAPRRPDYRLDLDACDRLLTESSPEVTFLCSPNNPTGLVDPPEAILHVLDRAPGLVVVDEAYGPFAPTSALELLKGDAGAGIVGQGASYSPALGRLAVVRTFSKTWSMAAWRLGYLIGPPEVVQACEAVALPYHLSSVTQIAGVLALSYVDAMESRIAFIARERERVGDALGALPVETWPSHANFILFRPRAMDAQEVWSGLVQRSVLVRDCSGWPGLDNCLRVTIGTAADNDRFLEALEEVLGSGEEATR